MTTPTPAMAKREINRRKGRLAKGETVASARARATREGTFGLLKPALQALAGTSSAKKAPAVKAARPTGPGSRGGDPAKRAKFAQAQALAAEAGHLTGSAEFWAIYKSL